MPVAHVGAPVTVRVHRDRVRIWRDAACLADHPRASDGARRRVIDPAHFAPLFPQKRRAQAMLYRELLLGLGGRAPAFLGELSRQKCQNADNVVTIDRPLLTQAVDRGRQVPACPDTGVISAANPHFSPISLRFRPVSTEF